jgi:putative membrane protein
VVRWLSLLIGLGLFAWVVCRAGPGEILRAMSNLGWAAPLVLIPYGVVYLFDNLGWYLTFGQYATHRPSYRVLFRVRWAGESVNYIIPSAYVGGEAVKGWLLHNRGVAGMTAATSVVASKTCQTLAQVIFIALGAWLAMAYLEPGSPARYGMLAVTLGTCAVVVFLFWLQRYGMFSFAIALFSWIPFRINVLEKHRARLRHLDNQIYRFYHDDPARFLGSTGAYLAGWIMDALEILLVCWLLGTPIPWTKALIIEAFIGVAKAAGIFVPGALGVQESGAVFLFQLFSLPTPLGAAYAIVRRGREVIFALAGVWWLYAEGATWKMVVAPGTTEGTRI